MTTSPEILKPPVITTGPIGWIRANLFSTRFNALLTVVTIALLYLLLRPALTWLFFDAEWAAVTSNLKLFAVGQYPLDEMWRVGVVVLIVSLLAGLSWRVWSGVARTFARAAGVIFVAMAFVPLSLDSLGVEPRLWILANPFVIGLGYLLARVINVPPGRLVISWAAAFVLVLILLRGFGWMPGLPEVRTTQLGGLMLTILLSVVGIVASFPLGVLLALGRRSSLPAVSMFCTLFIELIRGVPLITLLFMTQIILPLVLPQDTFLDFIVRDRVMRAFVAITVFSAAYMAENVRGGLQAVPLGQIDAAKALGLNGFNVTVFIVLPQALRAVIPAIVGQLITLLKDTSLVAIVALLDIVGIGRSIILGNVEWRGSQREVYLFLAAVFWVFTYSMSYASRKLEEALGVGRR